MGGSSQPVCRRGFSMLELVVVVAILVVIAAIAVPRMGSATERTRERVLVQDVAAVSRAIEMYIGEHAGRTPAHDDSGSVGTSGGDFVARLMLTTDGLGGTSGARIYGPYIRRFPANPVNGLSSVRIGGAAAGAGTHGWRFDATTTAFEPDHSDGQTTEGRSLLNEAVTRTDLDSGGITLNKMTLD